MSPDTAQPPPDHLGEAHEALARGAWASARAWFEGALERDETPEALEGLAIAAWWQNDGAVALPARERAYQLYRERGDRRGAARVAAFHAVDYCSLRNEPAIASGWIQRARRLLDGLEASPEHAMLHVFEGHIALSVQNDTGRARQLSSQATVIARSIGAIDWEMFALALEGLALVIEGEVEGGMRCLDEAATAAVAGEMTDLDAISTVCCYLIHACERVRDYDRAAQWCELVKKLAERWSSRLVFSLCRTHYAGVLMWRGAWAEAEAELAIATSELAAIYPAMAAEGIARLGELRRRQGRLDDAAALFRRAESHPLGRLARKYVLLGRAALALDQDDSHLAADLARRFLRSLGDDDLGRDSVERAAGLELLVRAQSAQGEHDQALGSLRALQSISNAVATLPVRAAASFAAGCVAADQRAWPGAQRCFEDAVDHFASSGAPYETALARLELATTLVALKRYDSARNETQLALDSLRDIGALREIDRANALVLQIAASASEQTAETAALGGLTPRELDILRLVAQGLTNKEIAAQLQLSRHTVHRHLANILTKLNLPSRAAAAAHAARHGLL